MIYYNYRKGDDPNGKTKERKPPEERRRYKKMKKRTETIKEAELQFCQYLESEMDKIHLGYLEEVQGIREYADENLEYSRGADYDLMVSNAQDEEREAVGRLFDYAVARGVSEENLERVFDGWDLI